MFLLKNLLIDFKHLFSNFRNIFFFFLILPFIFFIFYINFFLILFFILFYLITLLYYLLLSLWDEKKQYCIEYNENLFEFKNPFLVFFYKVTFDYSNKMAFIRLYDIILIFKKIVSGSEKTDFMSKVILFFKLIENVLVRYIILYITTIPYIFLKYSINATYVVDSLFLFNFNSKLDRFYCFLSNLIIKFTGNVTVLIKDRRILIEGKKILLNPRDKPIWTLIKELNEQIKYKAELKEAIENINKGSIYSNCAAGDASYHPHGLILNKNGEVLAQNESRKNTFNAPDQFTSEPNERDLIGPRSGSINFNAKVYDNIPYIVKSFNIRHGDNNKFLANLAKDENIRSHFTLSVFAQWDKLLNRFVDNKITSNPNNPTVNEYLSDDKNKFNNAINTSVRQYNFFCDNNKPVLDKADIYQEMYKNHHEYKNFNFKHVLLHSSAYGLVDPTIFIWNFGSNDK